MAGNERSGRHRLPIGEHIDAGSYRADRHGPIPDAAEGVPTMPRDLDTTARACWKAVVGDLVSRGLARQIDTLALRQLCELWSLYRAALKLAKKSPTDKDVRCAVLAYRQAWEAIARRFGLTYGDRQKLHVQPRAAGTKNVSSRKRA